MKHRFILFAFILCAAEMASAQNLAIFNLDATNFPTIKAKFYAFDANGKQQSPSASEITVAENGILRNVTSINCPTAEAPKQLSSVLVMDVSGSMADGSGTSPNIDIAKAAATYWISNVPLGESECAITSFDDNNYFNQDYTTNRTKLANAIAGLHPQNGTNYNAALLLPMSSGLEVTKLGKHQKVIVFLSDGLPNFEPQTSAIIAEAQKQNCLIFAVTVGLPCPQCLKDISNQTGAKWFENITSQAQIEEVYQEILQQAQGGSPCEISWQSNVTCVAGATNVQLSWSGQTAQQTYTPPASSVANLQFTPQSLYIRSKPVGVKFDTTVTISANNSAFSVTNITSTNPSYDINPKTFTLAAGQSKTLTVSYTPPDSSYTWTRFDIASDLCAQTYYASGSYPGHKPNIPTLKLTQPNGGEFLVVGSDTVITWKGIPLTDTVKLEYSTDAGSSWNFITDKATSGRYAWHVPKTVSDRCLVRVGQTLITTTKGWATEAGGSDYDMGYGIAIDAFGNIYVTGTFRGIANFGGIIFKDTSVLDDIFIVKFHPDQTVEWAKRAGGVGGNQGTEISVDLLGNAYVTGYFNGNANFDGITLTSSGTGYFIAKYHTDGNIEWAKTTGNIGYSKGESITVDISGNIYVTGQFGGKLDFGGYILNSNNLDIFVAKYHSDGTVEWAKTAGGKYDDEGTAISVDGFGNVYLTGSFKDTAIFDQTKLISRGDKDIFIAKYQPDGKLEWVNQAGGIDADVGLALAADPLGFVYVAGLFGSTADFGNISLIDQNGNGFFLAKYRPDGTVEWAKHPDGNINTIKSHIAIDPLGFINVTGTFSNSMNFDGKELTCPRNWNIFVTKYTSNGNVEWAKQADGPDDVDGRGIASDGYGNIYVTGLFSGTSSFADTILSPLGADDIFVWKIANNFLQSDTSDAVFSIVMPQTLSEDVDMGKVLVNSAKDSVIQKFIRNGGSYPFRVDSIAIIGADASQFSLVSGIPPFTIASGSAHQVEFDFRPTSSGIKYGQIEIFTQADTLIQNITGTGIAPELFVFGNTIDFGLLEINTFMDTTITAAIVNNGNTAINFTGSSQLGPDMKQFSLRSGDAPFTLSPGASHTVTLRFAPKLIGRTSGRIAFSYNGANSPAILNFFGQAMGGLIIIPNDSGYGGDHKNMPLILKNESIASVQKAATNFRAKIAYDHSVLTASGASIQAGNKFDTLTINNSLGISDTLAFIPFTALAGTKAVSPMRIVDFTWLNGAGLPGDHDAETESGIFHLLSASKNKEPNWETSIVEIFPNPTKESFHFEVTTSEAGRTQIELINILGQKVATIFDGELKRGAHQFDFTTHDLRTGSYYLRLITPTQSMMKKVDVIR